MDKYYVGIDTSAYTTSLAAVDQKGGVVFDEREVLEVSLGQRGLRQQEAVFQHVNNLPKLISKLTNDIDIKKIVTVSASIKPRNKEESYMPVFKVSQGQAFILSKILSVNYKEFSHQEGHIAAGLLGCEVRLKKDFLALHISGGTTELLYVKNEIHKFDVRIIGGTKDISAGQLIDRVGVKLGLKFPCGSIIEGFSEGGKLVNRKIPINTDSTWLNYSGAETFFYKLISEGYKIEDIALSVLNCIARTLVNIIENAIDKYKINDILIIGGVASNTYIREIIIDELKETASNIYFPDKKYCTDNAIGIAYLGSFEDLL